MNNLETILENSTLTVIEFIVILADTVFDGISDSRLHDYLIGEGYFENSEELLDFYDNN